MNFINYYCFSFVEQPLAEEEGHTRVHSVRYPAHHQVSNSRGGANKDEQGQGEGGVNQGTKTSQEDSWRGGRLRGRQGARGPEVGDLQQVHQSF